MNENNETNRLMSDLACFAQGQASVWADEPSEAVQIVHRLRARHVRESDRRHAMAARAARARVRIYRRVNRGKPFLGMPR